MSTSPVALALWGKLLTHNKIVTAEQWEQLQADLQHAGADATVESLLLSRGLLKPAHVEQVAARVKQLLGKAQGAPAAAPAQAAPPAAPEANAKPSAPADGADELMPEDSPAARGRKSSDTEWVETTDDTRAAKDFRSKDIAAIDLTDSDPATPVEKKKIWTPTPGQWDKPMTGPTAEGAGRSKNIPQIPLDGEE